MAIIYGRPQSEKDLLKKYPRRVQKIDDIERVHREMREELKVKERGLFGRIRYWNKQMQANMFQKNRDDLLHPGARGELLALKVLSRLDAGHHVFCGLNMGLPNYVTYNGQKNLRSAQMDFVVVSKRGVVLIEVKNWSTHYYKQDRQFSPHEQVDRAGRVLWIALKSWRKPTSPKVTNVILSIHGNIRYDPHFRFVLVSDLSRINSLIENRDEEFSDKEVKRIVDRLKPYVSR